MVLSATGRSAEMRSTLEVVHEALVHVFPRRPGRFGVQPHQVRAHASLYLPASRTPENSVAVARRRPVFFPAVFCK